MDCTLEEAKQLLKQAVTNPNDPAWQERVKALLDKKAVPVETKFTGARWEGEVCGNCGHSSTYHCCAFADSTDKACSKMDCECMKFVPTGKQNENAR